MKTLTLSFMKENKPIYSKKIISLNEQEKELLLDVIPFLVLISIIIRLLGANNHPSFLSEYISSWSLIVFGFSFIIFAFFLLNGLFKRQKTGWILTCIFQGILLIFDLSVGNSVTGFLTLIIGFWMLLQVREKYR
jgi:hypothetical protein